MPDTTPSPAPHQPPAEDLAAEVVADAVPVAIETYARDHVRAGYMSVATADTVPFEEYWAALAAQRSPTWPAPDAEDPGEDVIDRLLPEELERWGKAQGRMMTVIGLQRRAATLKARAEAELQTMYYDFGDRAGVGDEVVPSAVDPLAGVMRRVPLPQGMRAATPAATPSGAARDARG